MESTLKSVEPLIEQIKNVFSIGPLPVRGLDKASSIVLLSALPYQMAVYTTISRGDR